jgi:V/A-type H+-transporting ATPase subunit E
MKLLDTGKDKVKKICDIIKKETLEPAHEEAKRILDEARLQAQKMIQDAKKEAEAMLVQVKKEIENEKAICNAALNLAAKQTISGLKQKIETALFNPVLYEAVLQHAKNPQIIAECIQAMVCAIEKEGLDVDPVALIPASISPREINALLTKEILNRLEGKSVELGTHIGGAQIKLKDRHLTLDLSDSALRELLAAYISEDFRKLIFQEK